MADEAQMFDRISAQSQNLGEFVLNFVNTYAKFPRNHAPMMRVSMDRTRHDPLVSGPGKIAASRAARLMRDGVMVFSDEFGSDERGRRALSAFGAIFSTLARHLALGSSAETADDDVEWDVLRQDLARMCLAYLKNAD